MRSNISSAWIRDLATAVRAQRKRLGISQLDLAAMAGCGPVFIHDLESGKKATLRLDKVVDVLRVLGLELALRPGKRGLAIDEALR